MPTPEEKEIFSTQIARTAFREKITIIEAIMEHCERTGLEIEVAATLLTPALKEKLESVAGKLNLLKTKKKRKKK